MVKIQIPESIQSAIHQAGAGARAKAWAASQAGAAWLSRFRSEAGGAAAARKRARRGTVARLRLAARLRLIRAEARRRRADALAQAMAEGRTLAAHVRQMAEAERRGGFYRRTLAEARRGGGGVVVSVPAWGGRDGERIAARQLTLREQAERLAERLAYWRGAERLGGAGAGAARARRLRIGRELRAVRAELRRLAEAWCGAEALARARASAKEAREVRKRNQGRGGAPSLSDQLRRHPLGKLAEQAAEHAARTVEGGQLSVQARQSPVVLGKLKPAGKRREARQVVESTGAARPGRGIVSEASRAEAMGEALAAAWAECVRLAGRSGSAARLAELPAWVPGAPVSPAGNRRRYLFGVARRAAFADLTRLPAGFTGARGSVFLVELTEWGRGAECEAEAEATEARRFRPLAELPARSFEHLPPTVPAAQALAARQRLFQLCGSPCPVVRRGGSWNKAEATWSARRRFDFLSLVLAGEGWGEAARLAGWQAAGEGLVRNCIRPALELVGLKPEAIGIPWDSSRKRNQWRGAEA